MPNVPSPGWLKIPTWLDGTGAADAARMISNTPALTKGKRERLERLVSETKSALSKLPKRHRGTRKLLSADERYQAQFDLMATAYNAADDRPIGRREIEQTNETLARIAGSMATSYLDVLSPCRAVTPR